MGPAGSRIFSIPTRVFRSSSFLELAPLLTFLVCGAVKSFYVCASFRNVFWAPSSTFSDWILSHPQAATSSIAGVALPLFFLPLVPRVTRFGLLLFFHLILSLIVVADLVHLNMLSDVIPATSFNQLHMLPKFLWNSRHAFDPVFIVLFGDVFLWVLCAIPYIKASQETAPFPRRMAIRVSLGLTAVGGLTALPTLQVIVGGEEDVFAYFNVRREVVARIGLLPFHFADVIRYQRVTRRRPTPSDLQEIHSFIEDRLANDSPRSALFGVAKDRNLILISAESLQSFPIGMRIDGRDITPRLTAFAGESLDFTAFYDQTHLGTTSDGEFIALNSFHAPAWGTVAYHRSDNFFRGLPTILSQHGYDSVSACGAEATFWNMKKLHRAYGFDDSVFADRFTMKETMQDWLVDKLFFEEVIPFLRVRREPFMAFLISTSNHWPFVLPEGYEKFDVGGLEATSVGNYLQTVHYFDEAFGQFLDLLDEEDLLERSVIALYADHQGFLNDEKELSLLPGVAIDTELDRLVLSKRIPFMIRLPGGEAAGKRSDIGGQLDITPTLLGLLGIDAEREVFLGRDLTAGGEGFTVFRDGSFLTEGCFLVNHLGAIANCRCYDPSTAESIACAPFAGLRRRAQRSLKISDFVFEGNLLPFVRPPDVRYSLRRVEGSEVERIVTADGRTVPIMPGSVVGSVDRLLPGSKLTWVAGWAVDGGLHDPVDEIVVFVNGEAAHFRRRPVGREDVRKIYPEVAMGGYHVLLRIGEDVLRKDPDIRVFGISKSGVASELKYGRNYNSQRQTFASPPGGFSSP